ncbi:MAG: flagellar protein FlaG [Deltaproteobacteria bacterium]|nr:flagellar protein FlaG [Deltaproteobacteria bacterium]MBW2100251.1 flagellar protein FlaG [Deltaproteobacteria bacterium]
MINSINTEKIQSQEINLTKVESSSATEENARNYQPEHKACEEIKEVSQVQLDELQNKIERINNFRIQFSEHEATGRTLVKVIDKETEELIREVPPEDLLNALAKLDEMIGILFDKKV